MRLIDKSTFKVTRYGEQFIDEFGLPTTATSKSFTIKGNWQPVANSTAKGELAAILPDGVRVVDTIVLYTKYDLLVDDEAKQTIADEVDVEGILYKVFLLRSWNRYLSIKHNEYYLTRKNKR